jgi:hypothetical protein
MGMGKHFEPFFWIRHYKGNQTQSQPCSVSMKLHGDLETRER